jgi:hypothetical protein
VGRCIASARKSLYLDGVQGDVSGALINNLGFVGVSARSGRVIIRFNPKAVSGRSRALYSWLSSHISTRICLTFAFSGQDQRYEIFASARAALLRMEALLDCEHRLNWTPLFSARAGMLDTLSKRQPFAALFDYWRATSGAYTESAYLSLLNQFAADRYVVFEPRSEGGFNIARAGRACTSRTSLPIAPWEARGSTTFQTRIMQRGYRALLLCRLPEPPEAALRSHSRIHQLAACRRVERTYTRLILPCQRRMDGSSC